VDRDRLHALLEAVKEGRVAPDAALETLARAPYVETADGRIDVHRALRQGLPEVIYGAGKTPRQIADAVRTLVAHGQSALVTRVGPEPAAAVLAELPDGEYLGDARLLWFGPAAPPLTGRGTILVVCAGTADLPVAREASEVARRFGNKVELLVDVGVAGLHRLLDSLELLRSARVLIVVAGMEGALPSVVAGLVAAPVIAVPTSVGYGAAFGGVAALLAMLNSCAPNVGVVNIDNGFGAAALATLINRA
jgi:pyridinium-3,5-biscarboxylic acid mononucleotide synthase